MKLWLTQLFALVTKEFKQIIRDPSSYMVAFILPMIFLLFFGYAINLDAGVMHITIINESNGALAKELSNSFIQSSQFIVHPAQSRQEASKMMSDSQIRGMLIIPEDFDTNILQNQEIKVQIIVDGTEPNSANFIQNYSQGVIGSWQIAHISNGAEFKQAIEVKTRMWYNTVAKSRWALVPGSITIVMTLIGTLLTSLVISREWERGTMEAIFASPVTRIQIILGKLIPYYTLAMLSLTVCTIVAITLFAIPFRGSIFALFVLSTAFLMPALGQGLLISTLLKNQLLSATAGFLAGMLPAMILSGTIYDINSMPQVLQYLTLIIPARYYNISLQTVFLAGDIWSVFIPAIIFMLSLGLFFFILIYKKTIKSLD